MKIIPTESIPEIDEILGYLSPERHKLIERNMALAAKINNIMSENGISRSQLAHKTNIRSNYINRILRGGVSLNMSTIARLEIAMGEDLITINL